MSSVLLIGCSGPMGTSDGAVDGLDASSTDRAIFPDGPIGPDGSDVRPIDIQPLDVPPAMDVSPDATADAMEDGALPVDVPCTPGDRPPPHPAFPWAGARTSGTRAHFYWRYDSMDPPTATRVEICLDRACTTVMARVDASLTYHVVSAPLPAATGLYWRARANHCGVLGTVASVAVPFITGRLDPANNGGYGVLPDFDGDGLADLAIGSPATSSVYLYRGGRGGIATTPTRLTNTDLVAWGTAVSPAGDVNGDGYVDLMVGSHGGVTIHFGSSTGPSARPSLTIPTPPGGIARFGEVLTSAGDTDRDGFADIVVGSEANEGYFFRGGPMGPDPASPLRMRGPFLEMWYGRAVAGGFDVNADGFGDVLVGAPRALQAFIYFGGADGIDLVRLVRLRAPVFAPEFGTTVSGAGDIDGDGLGDILVDGGMANRYSFVWNGSTAAGVSSRVNNTEAPLRAAGYLYSSDSAFDLDADGYSDILVSAGSGAAVAAHVFTRLRMLVQTPQFTLPPAAPGSGALGLSGLGDVDGDGFDDVAIRSGDSASVVIYHGARGVMGMPRITRVPAPAGATDFGVCIAGISR